MVAGGAAVGCWMRRQHVRRSLASLKSRLDEVLAARGRAPAGEDHDIAARTGTRSRRGGGARAADPRAARLGERPARAGRGTLAGERAALCARGARRQRRHVGVGLDQRRRALLPALEIDPGHRRGRARRRARGLARAHSPRGPGARPARAGHARRRPQRALRDRASPAPLRRLLALGAGSRQRGPPRQRQGRPAGGPDDGHLLAQARAGGLARAGRRPGERARRGMLRGAGAQLRPGSWRARGLRLRVHRPAGRAGAHARALERR